VTTSDRLILTGSHGADDTCLGGKAANLRRLVAAGYDVPAWFVISTNAFDQALAPIDDHVRQLLVGIDFADTDDVRQTAQQIGDLILSLEWSPELCLALQQSLDELSTDRLSVRSSVLGEDSAEHSFAGQMASFLNVPPAEVPDMVRRVWTSAYSARALAYRHHKGICSTSIRTAVIVQRMVSSETSGVLFTREPETRARECVICAGYGLGEGIVADKVETDTFRIRWDTGLVSGDVSTKTTRLAAATDGGLQEEPVPANRRTPPVLSTEQIHRLHEIGMQVEAHFGRPQDLEWAFDAAGGLYLLQTRPIVFAPQQMDTAISRIWDNANVVESFPGLTLPLTFSFARQGYASSFRDALSGFLWQRDAAKGDDHIFDCLIGLLDGRVYYNLRNWYTMYSYLPGFRARKESFDRMIGVDEKLDVPAAPLSRRQRLGNLAMTAWRLLSVPWSNQRFSRRFDAAYSRLADDDLSTYDEVALADRYRDLERAFAPLWHLTLYNDFGAMTWLGWLQGLCRRWGLSDPRLPNDLLCGQGGIDSVEPVYALIEIAAHVNSTPALRALLASADDQRVWDMAQREAAYTEFYGCLNAHLQRFGDRGPEDLKLEKPGLREDPARLIALIRSYAERGLCVDELRQHEKTIRRQAQQLADAHLRGPVRRAIFGGVLRQTRRGIASRENMRFARSRVYGLVRRLFRRLGELFVERGLLVEADDLCYLTVEEALGTVQGTCSTADLRRLVALRKSDYDTFARRTPRPRLCTTRIPGLELSYEESGAATTTTQLQGTGCSAGSGCGQARIITEPGTPLGPGSHILVARSTDPGWVFLMIESKGIIVERGSLLSHTAIVGRELGIPTVVGVAGATEQIPEGARVQIDGSTGMIQWN
jgi:rifampicin phosphotransferase